MSSPSPVGQIRPRALCCSALSMALLLVFGAGARAQAPAERSSPLSLYEAVTIAADRAAAPLAADAQARAAREMAVAAAQRPDPVLRLALENLPVSGADRFSIDRDFMTMRSFGLMQTFTRADKRHARAQRFEREADAAQAERAVRVATVQRETAVAWFERRAAEQRLALLLEQAEEAGLQVEAAEASLRGGRGSADDVIGARDEVVQFDQALLGARAELASARHVLARWTGRSPERSALAAAPALEIHALVGRPVADGLERHPELTLLAAREAAAEAEASIARAEREHDWSAEVMFSQRGARYSNMVTVAVSLPLAWNRPLSQDRELAARIERAAALHAEREELARSLLAQTESWLESWRAGLARLQLIDAQRTPLVRQRIDAALGAYRGGNAALASVLAARRAALALQVDRIDVELQTARLWTRLEFLVPAPELRAAVPVSLRGVQP